MSELTKEILFEVMPDLADEQIEKFIIYYNLLVEWNQRVNLTRITEPADVARKHFADSVLGSGLIFNGARVADIGTGAGLPGIPIKILRPDIELVLIDSLGKRIGFLNEVCSAVGISAETIHARAEDAARQPGLREGFDFALSRAVAPMNVLLELTVPFVKVGGSSLMYKAAAVSDEIASAQNAFKALGCRASVHEYEVDWGARTIVAAEKLAPTNKKYPRKAGFVEKSPL